MLDDFGVLYFSPLLIPLSFSSLPLLPSPFPSMSLCLSPLSLPLPSSVPSLPLSFPPLFLSPLHHSPFLLSHDAVQLTRRGPTLATIVMTPTYRADPTVLMEGLVMSFGMRDNITWISHDDHVTASQSMWCHKTNVWQETTNGYSTWQSHDHHVTGNQPAQGQQQAQAMSLLWGRPGRASHKRHWHSLDWTKEPRTQQCWLGQLAAVGERMRD